MVTTLKDIRNTYLSFFEKNGHKILPASPLLPNNDPTLMFTNSGMVQFKNIFTGNEAAVFPRAATAQKCVRAGGKHNDLDNVGYTVRHHTFFEMMGNFSFGDYFKEDAIKFAWDLLTKDFSIPKEKLLVTVFHTDDAAYDLWKKIAGFGDDKIIRIPTKDNFWQMGDTGPCGPCSEIFYDHGPEIWGGKPGTPEEDGDRYIEIWNLVFDEFEDLPSGERIKIPNPSIDTGMGLERFTAIMQGVHSNYEIDLFQTLIKAIADLANSDPNGPLKASHNVIADHLRCMSFLIADGVLPSNEGRGYVLRRIMRRAMRHVHLLGIKEPMIYKLVPVLQKEMGDTYPELYRADALIKETIRTEETRFIKTMEKGLRLLDDEIEVLNKGQELKGEVAFKLYDTYGFPLDLTQDVLRAKDIKVDVKGFEKSMDEQKEKARKNWAGSGDAGTEKIWFELYEKLGRTEFLGYNTLKAECQIKALVQGDKEILSTNGGEFYLVSNQSPFYAESGGQVGDIGKISNEDFEAYVSDVKKKLDGLFVHHCRIVKGEAKVNTSAVFEVNEENRKRIRANHTVTHLTHKALREVLGTHVTQKGSMVSADRMRFDITHNKQVTPEELRAVEKIVNEAVRKDYKVATKIMTAEEAIESGAMALFGEKYGDEVRVVCVEDNLGGRVSMELCGGTHAVSTGEIGYFNIVSESAVAAGVRRIECLTGPKAEEFVDDLENKLQALSGLLKASVNDLEVRVSNLLEDNKKLNHEMFELRKSMASGKGSKEENVEIVNGVKFIGKEVENIPVKDLKAFVDESKKAIKSGVILLATNNDGKASVVVGVTDDLISKYSAVDLVKTAAAAVGGQGGGGRPDMAQAGGPNGDKIQNAIDAVRKVI
ncbi:MAG: alanine--tRNA ligase [Lactobacillaceae bacterium]|jgi:alanyl-tRNA synthetase|nr:alanine--tRNA ligase [Lactobacillaceae bacterium]